MIAQRPAGSLRALLLALLLVVAAVAAATTARAQGAADAALELRLKKLETELRCLVCQNQTIADSAAGLADDLRREVRALALAGKSDAEIKEYLVARYGDFILYNPPVQATTWLLWFGPLALLAGGGLVWFVVIRRRASSRPASEPVGTEAPAVTPESDLIAQARRALYEEP